MSGNGKMSFLHIFFDGPVRLQVIVCLQIYAQAGEIISSLLEYFTAGAVYIRALSKIYEKRLNVQLN